jgi:hypothetical protein
LQNKIPYPRVIREKIRVTGEKYKSVESDTGEIEINKITPQAIRDIFLGSRAIREKMNNHVCDTGEKKRVESDTGENG